jgi:hypothetical protein
MKLTPRSKAALQDLAKMAVPDDKKVKVEAGAIRDLAMCDVVHRSAVMACVAILAKLADTPIQFEIRRDIDAVLNAINVADGGNQLSVNEAVKQLTTIAGIYNR